MAKNRKSNLARNSSRARDTKIVASHESEEETQTRLALNAERHIAHGADEKTKGQRRSRRFFDSERHTYTINYKILKKKLKPVWL